MTSDAMSSELAALPEGDDAGTWIGWTTVQQSLASDPTRSAWVSANAGSGKTHVLTQRVIRLLLAGARPSAILSLTDTKAAVTKLERGEVDILIGGHLPESSQCARHRLFDERFVCITDALHHDNIREMKLDAFAELPHVLFSATGGDNSPGVIDTLLSRHGLKRRIAVTLAHVTAVPFTVAGSDLIATMAERVARLLATVTSISIQTPPFEAPVFSIDLLQARKSAEEGGIRWLVDAIHRAIR